MQFTNVLLMSLKSILINRSLIVLLIFIGLNYNLDAQDIHQNVCLGGQRLVSLTGSTPNQVRWHVENVTAGTTVSYTTNEGSYNFQMPSSGSDVYAVYAQTRANSTQPWGNATNRVVMYPYSMPDAIIDPSGSVPLNGGVPLNGYLDGAVPGSGAPITVDLDLRYEWRHDGDLIDDGVGTSDVLTATNEGYYRFRVYDPHERVSGCESTSPATLVTQNTVWDYPVCEGGFIIGDALLAHSGIPAGQRSGGEWTVTSGLNFSTTDGANPTISGFTQGNSYLVTWQRNPAQSYSFNLITGADQNIELLNESGNTSGVILCAASHNFTVSPAGDIHTFLYRNSAGTSTILVGNVANPVYSFTPPTPGENYEIYAIVERGGCFFETNSIDISSDEDIEIRVDGDRSICEGDLNFSLRVVPFDSDYSYSWERNSIEISTGEFADVSVHGEGTYIVTVTGCGGNEYSSQPVEIVNHSLPEVLIAYDNLILCSGTTKLLNGYLNGAHPTGEDMVYRWLYNSGEVLDDGFGSSSTWNAANSGQYSFMVMEDGNSLCYAISDPVSLSSIELEVSAFYANGPTVFCGLTFASATVEARLTGAAGQITVELSNITSGTTQSVILNSGEPVSVPLGILSTSTTFRITSVSAGGCSLSPAEINLIPEINYIRETDPLVFNVTGNDECSSGNVGVALSEIGVDYFLYRNGVYTGQKVDGTGLPVSFGEQAQSGIYTVRAERSGCENLINMNGQVVIYEEPLTDQNIVFTGSGCSGNPHSFRVENAEADVFYSLNRDNVQVRTPRRPQVGTDFVEFAGEILPGTYSIVASRGACSVEFSQTFIIDQTPLQQVITETEGCEGTPLLIGLENSEENFEYHLYNGPNGTGSIIRSLTGNGEAVSFAGTISAAGTYSVVATNPGTGCSVIFDDNIVISARPELSYTLSTSSDPICGNANHIITLSNSQGGIRYRLYLNDYDIDSRVNAQWGNEGNPINFAPQGVVGTYLVTADNNGCEYPLPNAALTINPVPLVRVLQGDNVCAGEVAVISIANSQPGVQYLLLRDGNPHTTAISGTGGTINWSGEFPTGIYTAIADVEGCITPMTGDVRVNPLPSNVTINNLGSNYCDGAGIISFNGFPIAGNNRWIVEEFDPLLPTWFTDGGNHTASINVDEAISASGPGSYTITYEYQDPNNGCINTASRVVNFHPDITDDLDFEFRYSDASPWQNFSSIDPIILCQDIDPIDLRAVFLSGIAIGDGDFSSSGSGLINTGSGTATFDPNIAGIGMHTIVYTYTDTNGCTGSIDYQIQVGVQLQFFNLNTLYCIDDATFTVSAGPVDAALPLGGVLSIYREGEATPIATDNQTPIPAGTNPSLSINPAIIGAGTYIFEYVYETGSGDDFCANTITRQVVIPQNLSAEFVTQSGNTQFCESQNNVVLVPDQPGGVFIGTGVSGNVFSPAVAGSGDHQVTYTINTGGCFESESRMLTVVELPDIYINNLASIYCESESQFQISANTLGDGGDVTFSSTLNSEGVSPIVVDNGDGTAEFDPAVAGPGIYFVTMTYEHPLSGCVNSVTDRVEVFALTYVNFDDDRPGDDLEYCQNGGDVTFTANLGVGATGVGTFILSGGVGTELVNHGDNTATLDPSALSPGNYTLTFSYENINGCIAERVKEITILIAPLVFEVQGGGTYCIGGSGVNVLLSGSQPNVTYELLLNGLPFATPIQVAGTGNSIVFSDITAAGTYSIRAVNNTSGCEALMNGSATVLVNEVSLLVQNIQNASCNSGNDASIQVTASGGSVPYVYYLYESDGTTLISSNASGLFIGLSAGNYFVEVEDAIGCELIAPVSVIINEPASPLTINASSQPVGCMPCTDGVDCEGSASITISGGTPFSDLTTYPTGFNIEWRDSGNNIIGSGLSINQKPAGDYTYIVEDANGCIITGSIEIETIAPITVNEDLSEHVDVLCNGNNTGEFLVIAAGGATGAVYQFSLDGVNWFPANVGTDGRRFVNRVAGTYSVSVRDVNSPRCIYTSDPIVISQPDPLTLDLVPGSRVHVDCFGNNTGSFQVVADGGSGDYEFSINNGMTWVTNPVFIDLPANSYNVRVRDAQSTSCMRSLSVEVTQPSLLSITNLSATHVSCHAGNNGTLSVTASGGTAPYGYRWEFNDGGTWTEIGTSSEINNRIAGTYRVIITDANGCGIQSNEITINQPASSLNISVTSNPTVCSDVDTGSATVTIAGGTPLYSVFWYQAGVVFNNNETVTDLSAGSYSVRVEDANGCWVEESFTIAALPSLVIENVTVDDHVLCNGGNNGRLTVRVSGGSELYRFSLDGNNWFAVASQLTDNGDGTFSYQFENLTADNYTVYVKDAANHSCQIQFSDVLINEPVALSLQVQLKQDVTCYSGNNGLIRFEAQGGTPDYEYSINGGAWQSSNEFTNLSAGSHNIRVRDDNGCVYQMAPVNIAQPVQLQVFVDDRGDASCFGAADGFILARATGGSGNYVYSLDGTDWQANPLFENLAAATYQLHVRDADDASCESTQLAVIITQPAQLVVTEVAANHQNVSCHGGNNGSFRVRGEGGTGNYEFSINNIDWFTNNTAYYTFNNLEAGSYNVYIKEQGDDDCSAVIDDAIIITEPTQSIAITDATLNHVECHGESTGSINITVEGGNETDPYNYVWERPLSGGGWTLLGAANDGTTASPTNLQAGTYRVVVTDSEGCSVTATYEITQPASPLSVTLASVQHVTANGGSNGALSINITGGTGGYVIAWTGEDVNGDPIAGLPINQTDLSGLVAGIYTADVTDGNNCTAIINVEILEPGHPLQLIQEDITHPLCFGENTGGIELRATGGVFPYTVTLTRSSGEVVTAASVSGNIYNYTGLSAGFYNAVVEDGNGETFSIPNIEITQPTQLALNVSSTVDATCFGNSDGQLSFSTTGGSPGYTYTLIPDNGASRLLSVPDDATQLYNDLPADRYRLMVQDANGCATPQQVITIGEPDEISITGTPTNISCFGADDGRITIDVTGGRGTVAYDYFWYEVSQPAVQIANTRDITNLESGSYQLQITEQAGTTCSATSDIFTITEPSEIVVSVDAFDVNTCTGDCSGRLVVNVTGGTAPYLIDYEAGTTTGSGPLFNIENLIAGNYTVRVVDNNGVGCEIVIPDNVIGEPAAPISLVSLDFGIDCDATQTTSGFVTFEVTGGLSGGDYEAVLRNISNPAQPPIGLTILEGDVQPLTIPNLRAAQYELTITNRNVAPTAVCPAIVETFELTHLVVSGNVTPATCSGANNGAIDITIAGGSGSYTYSWTKDGEPGFSSTEQDLSGLTAGSYTVAGTDVDRGCTVSQTFVVQDGKTLVVEASVSAVSCNGGNNGAIIVTNVANAAPPLQFYWNGVPGTDSNTGLTAGVYELRVVDGEGCEVIRSFTVPEPPTISYTLSSTLDVCEPFSRSIEIETLTGGVSPYTITWSGPGTFTVVGGNLSISDISQAGTYKALVRDSRGCETERSITVPGRMNLSANVTHISCKGGNNGMIDLVISGGSGNYQYAWIKDGVSIANTTQDIDNLEAGTYRVVVTDVNQVCDNTGDPYTEELEVIVAEPTAISINFTKQHLTCAGDANGIINITEITGGTGSYTLTWAPASAPGIIQGQWIQRDLQGGEYTVTIRDENNCVLVQSFEIIEPAPLNFTLEVDDTDCDGNNRIGITNPVGGSGLYTYVWAGPGIPAGFSGLEQTDLPGGEYTITMVDNDPGIGNCAIEKSVILTRPLQVEAVVTNASCPGVHNGAITLNITHGVAPYTFNWETISGTAVNASDMNQSGLRAGLYRVTVTDARGCDFLIDNIEVEFMNQLDIGLSVVNVTCHGDSNGRIEATVSGGSGEYQFSLDGADWTTGFALTHTFEDLTSGSYTVFVRDVNLSGCYTTKTVDVLQPAAPIDVVETITHVLCKDDFTGEIEVEVAGGTAPYTYQWTTTTGGGLVNSAQNQDGLSAGIYHLRVVDAEGCVANFGPFEVTEPVLALNVEIVEVVNVAIPGDATGAIEVSATGGSMGYSYAWELYDEDLDVWNPITGVSHRIENRIAGLYRVTVTDGNGCVASLQQRITEPGTPLTIDTQVDHIGPCHGAANGSIEINISGGNPKMDGGQPGYDVVVVGPGMNETRYGTSFTFNNLLPGTYQISATDDSGIIEEVDVTINQPDELIVNIEVIDDVTCYAGNDGRIRVTVSGGMPNTDAGAGGNYRIRLSGNGVNRIEEVDDLFLFENLAAGSYQVTVWDDFNGDGLFNSNYDCRNVFNDIIITQPEAHAVLSVMPGSTSICEGNIPQLQVIVSNWDVVANPLELTLNDGTVVTVNQTPYVFDADEIPPVGISEYAIVSLINPATTCSAGTFTGTPSVVVNPLPTATISGDNGVCLGGTVDLRVDLTGTPPWNITYSNGVESFEIHGITESIYTIENVEPLETRTFTILEVTDVHCTNSGSGSAVVTVDQPTTVEFVETDLGDICRGENIELQFRFNPSDTGPWVLRYREIDPSGTVLPVLRQLLVNSTDLDGDILTIEAEPRRTARYEIELVRDRHGSTSGYSCNGVVLGGPANVIVRQLPYEPDAIVGESVVCQGTEHIYSVPAVLHAETYEWTVQKNAIILSGQGTREINVRFSDDVQSGYIYVKGINSCGDGSIQRHYVTINPLPLQTAVIEGPVNICQGSSEIIFRTDQVIHATSYIWNVPDGFTINGDATGATISITPNPDIDTFTGQISVTPVNDCGESLFTATHTFNVRPLPSANAGLNAQICGTTHTLGADALLAGETGLWMLVPGSGFAEIVNPDQPNSELDNIARGNTVLRWTVTSEFGCSSSDEVTIRNNQLPVYAYAENNLVCDGTASLFGSVVQSYPNTSGVWSAVEPVGSTAAFANAASNETTVSNLAPGSNLLRWTITQNGCPSYADVEVVNHRPDDAIIQGAKVIDRCDEENISLEAEEVTNGTGRWSIIEGFVTISPNPESRNITVSEFSEGEIVIRWAVTNNSCSVYDEVTIRNNKVVVSAGATQEVCENEVFLSGTEVPAGATGSWEFITGSGNFNNGTIHNPHVTNLAYGINELEWRIEKNGCISASRVIITNNSPATATVGSPQIKCSFATELTGNNPNGQGVGRWSIVTGSGDFDDITDPVTEVTNLGYGENIFRWTISNGSCSSSADLVVNNLHVAVDAGKDFATCTRTVTMNGSPVPAGMTGLWQISSGSGGATIPLDERNKPNATISVDYGTTTLIWTITNGTCVSSDNVIVTNNMPYPVEAGPYREIDGSTYTFEATPVIQGTGNWELISGGGEILNPSLPNAQVTNLRRGENIFRWTVTHGDCTIYDEVTIVNGQVTEANAGLDRVICSSSATLNANDPDVAVGTWSVVSGTANFENRNNPRTRVTNLSPGPNVLRWTIEYSTSSSYDEVTITNNTPTEPSAGFFSAHSLGRDNAICADNVTLTGNNPGADMGEPSWHLVQGGGTIVSPNSSETEVNGLARGVNEFIYRITKGSCELENRITIINGTPSTPDAGEDVTICSGSYQLRPLPQVPDHGVASWRALSAGEITFNGNWVHGLSQGENVLAYEISTEYCTLTDEVVITNNEVIPAYAGEDRRTCGNEVVLEAWEAGTAGDGMAVGTWSRISGGGTFDDPNDPNATITGLVAGANRLRWTVSYGACSDYDEVIIYNDHRSAEILLDDYTHCADTMAISARVPRDGSGSWGIAQGRGNFDDHRSANTIVRNLQRGDNVITWTVNHRNCTDTDQLTITNNMATHAFAGEDESFCVDQATLSGSVKRDVETSTWTLIDGSGEIATPDNSAVTTVSGLGFGENIFRYTIRHQDCISYDEVTIENNHIAANAGPDRTYCSNEAVLAGSNPGLGVGTWSVPGGLGAAVFDNPNSPTTRVTNLGKGNNTLRWTVRYKGCTHSDDVIITNNLPVTPNAGNTQILCRDNTTLEASPLGAGEQGVWEVLTGSADFADENLHNTQVANLGKGDNILRWTTWRVDGCPLSEEVLIRNNDPYEPNAGSDYEEVCERTFTLKADAPEFGTGSWSFVQGGGNLSDPYDPRATITNLDHGTNILKWTVEQGNCARSARVTIENNTPNRANAGPDIEDCKDFHVLDANVPLHGATGRWERMSGYGEFDDDFDPKTTVRNLEFGMNQFRWIIEKGNCFSSDVITIFNMVPDRADAGSDRIGICENYLTLNANNPQSGTGRWSVVKGTGTFDNPEEYNSVVRNVGFGENIYRWSISYGSCSTEDEMTVVSHKTNAYAGEDQIVYEPRALLNANNAGNLNARWIVVGTSTAEFDDETFFNTNVYNLSDGINTFRWEIEVEGCIASDQVSIDYRVVPDAGFITDVDSGCFPLRVLFTNYSVGGSDYIWDFDDGHSSGERNPVHVFESPGVYNVRLIAPGPDGRDGEYFKEIVVHDHPVADFTVNPQVVYLPGEKARFYDLSIDAISWLWNFGDGTTSSDRNPSYEYRDEGVYDVSLTVTNDRGCVNTFTQSGIITAYQQGFVRFPNAFRPRPDGASGGIDPSAEYVVVFKPAYKDVDEFKLEIFNRWGQKIYETNDIDQGWDGMHDGRLAPQAVYVYQVSGRYISGREFRKTGSVLLVR